MITFSPLPVYQSGGIDSNRFKKFDLLKQVMQLTTHAHPAGRAYGKMVVTGDIGLGDYGAGCLHWELCIQKESDTQWFVKSNIATVDDGAICGQSAFYTTKEEAIEQMDKIAAHIVQNMDVFPTLAVLNQTLRPYGVFMCLE